MDEDARVKKAFEIARAKVIKVIEELKDHQVKISESNAWGCSPVTIFLEPIRVKGNAKLFQRLEALGWHKYLFKGDMNYQGGRWRTLVKTYKISELLTED